MKLSCLHVSFFSDIIDGRMSVNDWAKMGSEIGLDAIDLSILFVTDRSETGLGIIREQIESTGMNVAMITSYPDFTHPEASQRSKELELEIQVVVVARKLGAKMVRVTAGQAHPQTGRRKGLIGLWKDCPV
jgi:sugar phosphate isomerase/epimerase